MSAHLIAIAVFVLGMFAICGVIAMFDWFSSKEEE
jgi:hypothetical protein